MIYRVSNLRSVLVGVGSFGMATVCGWLATQVLLLPEDQLFSFIMYFGALFFGGIGFYVLWSAVYKPLVLEINDIGLRFTQFGDVWIPWSSIEDVSEKSVGGVESLHLHISEDDAVMAKVSKTGRWASTINQMFGLEAGLGIGIGMFGADQEEIKAQIFEKWAPEVIADLEDQYGKPSDQEHDKLVPLPSTNQADSADEVSIVDAVADEQISREPVGDNADGQEWWQTASKEFGERVAAQQRNRQPYGASKRRH